MAKCWQTLAIATVITTIYGCGSDGKDGVDGKDGAGQVITVSRLGSSESQGFGTSAAEIVAYDHNSNRAFTVNAQSGKVDIFSMDDLTNLSRIDSLDVKAMVVAAGQANSTDEIGAANSVAIHERLAAIAVEANPKTSSGWVVFVNTDDLSVAAVVEVGSLPDMVTFTPDGRFVVTAIEGEPEDYTTDPEGRVDIIDTNDFTLRSARFTDFNRDGSRASELPAEVRIYGQIVDSAGEFVRWSTVAEDLEPEYVAVSADSKTAYVSLQENNAIAVVDVDTATVQRIFPLGFKDHRLPGNELDASDKDQAVNIRNWPVFGMYQPDSIAVYTVNGVDYLVTANEGDSRADWGIAQSDGDTDSAGDPLNLNMEEFRIKDVVLDPEAFPDAQTLQAKQNLGRLRITSQLGDKDGDGDFDELYAYGGRSFSVWNAQTGEQVFDSGSDFEHRTAQKYGINFNHGHDEFDPDGRSDSKGPEPEALTLGRINGHTYAFIGLERMGGIFVYDISNPYAADFVQYLNYRDLSLDPVVYGAQAGDLGPEGFKFIPAESSPNGKPLLLTGNEVSGNTAVYEVNVNLLED